MSQPLETLKVSYATDDGAHENFDGTDALLLDGGGQISAFAGGLRQSQMVTQLFFTDGGGQVDLVGQNEEGSLGQVFNGEQALKEED